MSTAVATDLTQDRFKGLMEMVKEEADATLALIVAGHTPSPSSFNPQAVISELLAGAPAAALMPDHAEGALATQAKPLPPEIKRAITTHQDAGNRIITGVKDKTLPVTNKRIEEIKKGTGSNTDFRDKLDKIRTKNIEDFKKEQDKVFNKLVELGEKHPESQRTIVKLYQGVSRIFANAWHSVLNFFVDLVSNIKRWLTAAVNKVKQVFTGVVKGVVKGIGKLLPF